MITEIQKAQLISYITGEDINKVRLYKDDIVVDEKKLQEYIARVEDGESVARIIGKRWFWRDEFFIENTLEPRADSEALIEAVLTNFPDKTQNLQILDIGTGSGCLLLSLLREYKNAKGIGIDKSTDALASAKKNCDVLGLKNRCEFQEMDFTKSIPDNNFDIVISNPPYIKSSDIANLDKTVRDFDPYISLDGGLDGLDAYKSILSKVKSKHIFFEIGQGQENDIEKIATEYKYGIHSQYKDLGNIIRVLYFKN